MNSGIYIITCLVNEKYYIGYTKNFSSRERIHWNRLKRGVHHNEYLQEDYNKYGKEKFSFEILEEYPNEGFILPSMEHYWCNLLLAHDDRYGYNERVTNPYNDPSHSEKTRMKITKANKGRVFTEEHKENMKESWKNPNRKKSPPRRQTNSTKEKIREKAIARKWSQERKEKFSVTRIGKKNKKISSNCRPVLQFDLDMNFIEEWAGVRILQRKFKFDKYQVIRTCKGERENYKGFIWKYKDEWVAANPDSYLDKITEAAIEKINEK